MTDDAKSAKKYDREAHLRSFAAEMQRTASVLERQIKVEEDRAGRHDPSDVTYPMIARALRARQQKVSFTIATLQSVMGPSADAA
jgi:hypothetical protein